MPSKFFTSIILGLLFIFAANLSYAKPEVYQAKIAVDGQSEAVKRAAVAKALSAILIKRGIQPEVLNNPEAKNTLKKAHDFLLRYEYIHEKQRGGKKQKFIIISFDMKEVDRAFKKASRLKAPLPAAPTVAKKEVPTPKKEIKPISNDLPPAPTLFWLTVKPQSESFPFLAQAIANDPLYQAIDDAAEAKHLDILIPEIDSENETLAQPSNLWTLNKKIIVDLTSPYQIANVLAGRLYQTDTGAWQGSWLFRVNKVWTELETTGETLDENLEKAFAALKRKITPYEPSSETQEEPEKKVFPPLIIRVNNIYNLDKNAELLEHLKQTPGINKVEITQVQPNGVILKAQVSGDSQQIRENLERGKRLFAVSTLELNESDADTEEPQETIDLEFDWQGHELNDLDELEFEDDLFEDL